MRPQSHTIAPIVVLLGLGILLVGPLLVFLILVQTTDANGFLGGLLAPASRTVFLRALLRSVAFALIIAPSQIAVASILAILSVSRNWKMGPLVLLMPLSIAGLVGALIWKALLIPNAGFVDRLLSRIITFPLLSDGSLVPGLPVVHGDVAIAMIDTWTWLPVLTAFLVVCLGRIPKQLIESARLDGAGTVLVARRVQIPYVWPYLGIALAVRWADYFRIFDAPWSLFRDSASAPYVSPRIFTAALIERDLPTAVGLSAFAAIVALPCFLLASRTLEAIIVKVLHEE